MSQNQNHFENDFPPQLSSEMSVLQ